MLTKSLTLRDFKFFVKESNGWVIRSLDAEPSNEAFSMEYRATYWYLSYHILRDGEVELEEEDLDILFDEKNVIYSWIWLESPDRAMCIKLVDGEKWEFYYSLEQADIHEKLDQIELKGEVK